MAAVARILYEQGCNIADSSMTRLGGNFAMLLVVQAPEGRSPGDLLAALAPDAARLGLTVHADPAAEDAQSGGQEGAAFVISVDGAD